MSPPFLSAIIVQALLLNAARQLIPIYWKRAQIPGCSEWICLVNDIMAAEECMATFKGRHDKWYGK